MTKSSIIKNLIKIAGKSDIIVASTGYISRAIYYFGDRHLNFYMMGSMGNALAIGIGLALCQKRRVIVVSGDGAALMGLGSFVTAKGFRLKNLTHVIIDNGCHESTGGQPTYSHLIDFERFGKNVIHYRVPKQEMRLPRIPFTPFQIRERFMNALQNA